MAIVVRHRYAGGNGMEYNRSPQRTVPGRVKSDSNGTPALPPRPMMQRNA